jgi:NADH-quinone oxidoreductase subunit G
MPKISVDGRIIEALEGRSILQVLDDVGLLSDGVDVPHYCWHPKLSIDGSCRLCQVEIEGMPKLQIACNTPVAEGMAIRTDSERVRSARRGVMELLLLNHPLDCPICDQAGECKLQDYAFEYGVDVSRTREPRRALKKNVELGPTIVFDQERCILCRRCVRFCDEVSGTGELRVMGRGDRSVIETLPGEPLANDYSMNVADLCPVGALTTRDFRFKIRVWFLDDVPGVCTGCANGCNVTIGVSKNQVHRYQPRRNDAVNDTWLCDRGRLSYKQIRSGDRLTRASLRGIDGEREVVGCEAALDAAAGRLQRVIDGPGADTLVVLASPHASNEDLFTLRRFCDALGITARGAAVVLGPEDQLLMKAEQAANAEGARRLGFGPPDALLARLRGGDITAALVFGHDVLDSAFLGGPESLAALETLVVVDLTQSALASCSDVAIPVRHAAERHGSFTNFGGRVQRVQPAVEPDWEAWTDGEVVWRLAAALGLEGFEGAYEVHAVSRALAETVAGFAGVDLERVGQHGLPLAEADV